jgi:transcriptional regulator NrdR family protein
MSRFQNHSHLANQVSEATVNAINRTVHVKIHPRPRSLTESRQVLQELRRYGDVTMFRHLKVYFFFYNIHYFLQLIYGEKN